MHEDDEHVFAALRARARGYLVKGADGAEIVRAVQSVGPETPYTVVRSPGASSRPSRANMRTRRPRGPSPT